MGVRKRLSAEARKQQKASKATATLRNCPTSPRKMRLVADVIRGMSVEKALFVLRNTGKHSARDMEKVLLNAINAWQQKNQNANIDEQNLVVKTVTVGGGPMLKRIQPAPQGRAHRIRKRSNHVFIEVEALN
ncbi:50S ribosomal protein L22 [Schleiferia thermophila]|jgi:large subunit ribosomal protein L22|uniref:Large ribosomal subunit protein uL22 n=1 Tax=Schleiferia thermophila TaxID=884107 RepID=A0A369ABM2_9FLAO|nr:50S ribosomal protein L22 [Schleiferia thermophila]KFD38362.1 50S ribosomal protein L22 [Schleiferia thermophila str. Yellowstone]RCX04824.1 LSU ribosomal protein L22P [Schleiferia thermophila]GCD79649.1 50S ribosomal protein L22 [Schleiferia thermophila]